MPQQDQQQLLNGRLAALPNLNCPICGGPNGCAPAASGDLGTPCWCRQVTFTADLLAKVPAASKGQACICRRCAEAAGMAKDVGPGG